MEENMEITSYDILKYNDGKIDFLENSKNFNLDANEFYKKLALNYKTIEPAKEFDSISKIFEIPIFEISKLDYIKKHEEIYNFFENKVKEKLQLKTFKTINTSEPDVQFALKILKEYSESEFVGNRFERLILDYLKHIYIHAGYTEAINRIKINKIISSLKNKPIAEIFTSCTYTGKIRPYIKLNGDEERFYYVDFKKILNTDSCERKISYAKNKLNELKNSDIYHQLVYYCEKDEYISEKLEKREKLNFINKIKFDIKLRSEGFYNEIDKVDKFKNNFERDIHRIKSDYEKEIKKNEEKLKRWNKILEIRNNISPEEKNMINELLDDLIKSHVYSYLELNSMEATGYTSLYCPGPSTYYTSFWENLNKEAKNLGLNKFLRQSGYIYDVKNIFKPLDKYLDKIGLTEQAFNKMTNDFANDDYLIEAGYGFGIYDYLKEVRPLIKKIENTKVTCNKQNKNQLSQEKQQ